MQYIEDYVWDSQSLDHETDKDKSRLLEQVKTALDSQKFANSQDGKKALITALNRIINTSKQNEGQTALIEAKKNLHTALGIQSSAPVKPYQYRS